MKDTFSSDVSSAGGTQSIQLRAVLDAGGWTPRQKIYVLIVALAIIVDGFDNQVIGLTIPAMCPPLLSTNRVGPENNPVVL